MDNLELVIVIFFWQSLQSLQQSLLRDSEQPREAKQVSEEPGEVNSQGPSHTLLDQGHRGNSDVLSNSSQL